MNILLFQELVDYCKRFYEVLKHPFYLKAVEEIDDNKLEEALFLLEHILEERVMEVTLQDIDVRFNSAFNSYLYVPRFDFGNLFNSIEKIRGQTLQIHILCFYFEFCEVVKPDPGICIKKLIS